MIKNVVEYVVDNNPKLVKFSSGWSVDSLPHSQFERFLKCLKGKNKLVYICIIFSKYVPYFEF